MTAFLLDDEDAWYERQQRAIDRHVALAVERGLARRGILPEPEKEVDPTELYTVARAVQEGMLPKELQKLFTNHCAHARKRPDLVELFTPDAIDGVYAARRIFRYQRQRMVKMVNQYMDSRWKDDVLEGLMPIGEAVKQGLIGKQDYEAFRKHCGQQRAKCATDPIYTPDKAFLHGSQNAKLYYTRERLVKMVEDYKTRQRNHTREAA